MYTISLSLAFLLVLATVVLSWHRRHHRSKSSPVTLPPSPPKLPLVGHLHLVTDMPHHDFARLARKLGPIFYLRLGRVPTIVISSAQLAREVLKTHDHVFANRPQLISTQYISFGCSDARKICVVELLSAKRVNSFQLIRLEETNRLLNSLATRSGSEVNISGLLLELANDVLCRVAFGRRFEAKSRLGEVLVESQELFAGFSLGDFYPEWGWVSTLTGYRRRLERNLKDLKEVCDEIIREHMNEKKSFEEEVEKGDFLDVLMRVQRRVDLENPKRSASQMILLHPQKSLSPCRELSSAGLALAAENGN
ncbi:Cytochrome P450 [Dillenia turbinata]|uniref:Cytochrome P450 n=1 Tax=Dillenia turbinata TaxID=194707 RepID=A0AAN8V9P0_9MAGN